MTIREFENILVERLDTEYGEMIARYLMDKKYIPDSPLWITYRGTEEEKAMLEKAYAKKVTKDLLKYMDKKMKNDYQYGAYKHLTECL